MCLPPAPYAEMFGETPVRPRKGGVIDIPGYDPTRLGELMPHPVYAWMRWVQILSPARSELDALRPHLEESLQIIKAAWPADTAA